MQERPSSLALWNLALAQPAVWRRALLMSLTVGLAQVAINQGDVWLRWAVDGAVVAKSFLTPLVTFGVALLSAAGASVDRAKLDPQVLVSRSRDVDA